MGPNDASLSGCFSRLGLGDCGVDRDGRDGISKAEFLLITNRVGIRLEREELDVLMLEAPLIARVLLEEVWAALPSLPGPFDVAYGRDSYEVLDVHAAPPSFSCCCGLCCCCFRCFSLSFSLCCGFSLCLKSGLFFCFSLCFSFSLSFKSGLFFCLSFGLCLSLYPSFFFSLDLCFDFCF